MNDIPRRIQIDQFTPQEQAIRNAMMAVEAMDASPHLTEAVVLLQRAQEKVADFIDGHPVTQIPEIGAPFGGGFFAGLYYEHGIRHALIVAPKAEGQASAKLSWGGRGTQTEARSLIDGLTNTRALCDRKAGDDHLAAKFCRDLRIGGFDDWHLPALEQMSVLRANLTPEDDHVPVQTAAEAFREGGPEAFDIDDWYWTSTEWSAGSAWFQSFGNGYQDSYVKVWSCRVRAVRKCPL
jgi:hypothetical protein